MHYKPSRLRDDSFATTAGTRTRRLVRPCFFGEAPPLNITSVHVHRVIGAILYKLFRTRRTVSFLLVGVRYSQLSPVEWNRPFSYNFPMIIAFFMYYCYDGRNSVLAKLCSRWDIDFGFQKYGFSAFCFRTMMGSTTTLFVPCHRRFCVFPEL